MDDTLYTGSGFSTTQHMAPLHIEVLHQRIVMPEPGLAAQIDRLRRIRSLDPEQYRKAKTTLPWFIGATFREQRRNQEHFESLQHFVLDFDHCYESPEQFDALRLRIQADERVRLLFASPGGDGLKCVFSFDKPLTNTKLYADFYRNFVNEFAQRHGLERSADTRTFDVARVCFMSKDPKAWLNPAPVAVEWGRVVEQNLLQAIPPKAPAETPAPPPAAEGAETPLTATTPTVPDDVLKQLRQILNPGGRPVRRPDNFPVPEAILSIRPAILKALESAGIEVMDMPGVSHGQKFILQYRSLFAEVIVYHGKNGFSVVKSAKTGVSPELNDLIHELIGRIVFSAGQQNLDELRKHLKPGGVQPPDEDVQAPF